MSNEHELAKALQECFVSPNVSDSNLEAANIVDVLDRLASSIFALSKAIKEAKVIERG